VDKTIDAWFVIKKTPWPDNSETNNYSEEIED